MVIWFEYTVDFVLKKDENYYPQVILKECKYTKREKKMIRYITYDLKISFDDSDKENLKIITRTLATIPFLMEQFV